jgi:threonylcarbamoyladenosine tRNA methylthiotransferase MtaB
MASPISSVSSAVKFYLRTLGCKMNQLDSARISAALQAAGHRRVADEEEADCVLVNSCTVTSQADRKSRQAARAALRGEKQVLVLGCGPRADPVHWREQLPGGILFESEHALLDHLRIVPGESLFPVTARTRLPIAIQTGCDDTCTFCITRIARGAHRSEAAEPIVQSIREARELGVQEVVLTGINLAAWGCSDSRRAGESRLHELLFRILEQTEMPRIRLSSLGPQYLGPGFFGAFRDPRICDHLHLSIQSGSASVLRRMDRGHGVDEVYRVAEQARAARPPAALTADFIVGFPGESDAEFQETVSMVETLGLAKLHVFPFSAREGTPAASCPDPLPVETRKLRAAELRDLGRHTREAFVSAQLGTVKQVLVEHDETGLTSNYIRIRVPGGRDGELRDLELRGELIADRW